MTASREPPLDESVWRSPEDVQRMGGIHTNTVLHYFARSSFFDATSNNAVLTTQATHNAGMAHVIGTREAFEGALKTMQGLEFMVSHDPSENGHKIENSGVWVIRKQTRKKRQGAEDEISCISSYFVVGENIYMAPSVMSIISNRMLSVVTSANQMLSTMSTLPIFTPSLGHTYLPPAPKSINSATSTQVNQTSGGNTPIPGTQETLPSSKTLPASQAALPSDDQGFQMLAESYSLSLRYGSEYMDENALVGEPGSFIMSKTREPAPPTSLKIQTSIPMKSAESAETKTPTPFASGKKANRGTERSPISPSTKDKKVRRKSKAIGTVTPK